MAAGRCQPLVDAWIAPGADAAALDDLVRFCGGRRRSGAADLLLAPLRSVRGELVDRAREALTRLGLRDRWLADLGDRRWWRRAQAATALGLMAERSAAGALVTRLEDMYDEVRAAAVDALGRIGDPATLPALVASLADPRQQRVRVVATLRAFGPAAAEEIIRRCLAYPADRVAVAEVLGHVGSAAGLEALTGWIEADEAAVRAAAFRAIGDIGPDERAYYFALRALGDPDPDVRAMAARVIGRSGRADAASYLAPRLGDVWLVAAHAAAALKQLGEAGRRQLATAASSDGPGAELARQMMWELGG